MPREAANTREASLLNTLNGLFVVNLVPLVTRNRSRDRRGRSGGTAEVFDIEASRF